MDFNNFMKPLMYHKIPEFHEKVWALMNTTIIFMNTKYYECLGSGLEPKNKNKNKTIYPPLQNTDHSPQGFSKSRRRECLTTSTIHLRDDQSLVTSTLPLQLADVIINAQLTNQPLCYTYAALDSHTIHIVVNNVHTT